MGLKIAVIGGGSTYTPELVQGLADRTTLLPVDEVVLQDIDPDRQAIVAGLAERILRREGWGGRLTTTVDPDAAIDGASFVLIQLRVGGQATRHVDETLPHHFGCIGQETTGPGGFAKALRTVPVVLDLAERVGRHAAAAAWIIDFTNPVGIVTQALIDRGHRALGLCNVAIGIQRRMAARFGVTPEQVQLEHVGLNHLSWVRAIRVDGVDRLPGLIAEHAEELADDASSSPELIRTLRALPSYYLHYYYATREVLEAQLAGTTRAEDVMAIERELLELYRDPTLDRKPALLERRGGAFYSEAAVELMATLHAGTGAVHVVDVRNDGALPDLPPAAVVEIPARVDRDGAHPLPLAALAPEIRGLVQRAKAYEELAVRAATTGDHRVALLALLANPLVPDHRAAEGLLEAILAANERFPTRFAA